MVAVRRRTFGARIGGRSERVVRDVLRATIDELGRRGYGALRVEDVATRAGVNKTSVYRRWPTKAELVAAAVRAVAGHHEPLPETGSVREDLIVMLQRSLAFVLTAEGRALTRLIVSEGGDPDVERLARSLRESAMAQRAQLIARAQERGELPSGLDARVVLDAIFMPVLTRVMHRGEDVDPATAVAFVDLVLTGARNVTARANAP
ncbi:MAG TPA: TetR/AcrR family transcriptional regulator [Labilithrix sp.]|nr:TetR/AcrR family transcriptional regulator [Labilithrix sp.]